MAKESTSSRVRMEQRRQRSRHRPCIECNSQIFCSYVLALFSSALTVGGTYLAFKKWDHTWLILSIAGLTLMLIGSCMYYCGHLSMADMYDHENNELNTDRRKSRKRGNKKCNVGYSSDQLMNGERPLGDSRSVSQLSLNMIPQYFSAMDTAASHTTSLPRSVTQSMPYSQIFSVNGQSFLILPISGESNAPDNNCIQMQNMFFKVANNASNSGKSNEETAPSKKTTNAEASNSQSKRRSVIIDSNNCNLTVNETQQQQRQRQSTTINVQTAAVATNISNSANNPCGSTAFWIPVTNGQLNENVGVVLNNALPSQPKPVNRSNTFRKQNTTTTCIDSQQTHDDINSGNVDRDRERRLSFLISSTSEPLQTTENTPLISNQDSIRSTADECSNARVGTPSLTVFEESAREVGPCARLRNENSSDKTSTPPPSYDEVLSVDMQDDEEAAEVLIIGTI